MINYFNIKTELKNKKIAIVSNDAGGAQILSLLVLNLSNKIFYDLSGPAKNIFSKRNKIKSSTKLSKIISEVDLIITGTSFSSNLETDAIVLAKKYKKKVISFIDHWCNYLVRFKRNGKIILPDQILTGDKKAFLIAKKNFKNIKIKIHPNPYFRYIQKYSKKNRKKKKRKKEILFVSDNMDKVFFKNNIDLQILEKVFLFYKNEILKDKVNLTIRYHPSDKKDKFKKFLKNKNIQVDNNFDLFQTLKKMDVIAGYQSMAMVVGKMFGLKTVYARYKKHPNEIPMKYIDNII
jgi:hypothetical protein